MIRKLAPMMAAEYLEFTNRLHIKLPQGYLDGSVHRLQNRTQRLGQLPYRCPWTHATTWPWS